MQEYSDQEIVKSLRKQQSFAVQYLYDRYLPMIRLMVFQKGGTLEDAKDVFQDALIIVLQALDQKDFKLSCKLKTFFYSVAEKHWLCVVAKRIVAEKYLHTKMDDSVDEDFTEIYDNELYKKIFYEVFETLDPVCKKLLLKYWEEQSPIDIAKDLGYSYGYVRKKKCECQAELINRIRNHPEFKAIKGREESIDKVIFE